MNTENKKQMTPTQLAAALGVCTGTVTRWRKLGCPYIETNSDTSYPVRSRPRYDLKEVKQWFYTNQRRSQKKAKEKQTPKNLSLIKNSFFNGYKMSIQKFGFNFTQYFGVQQYETLENAEKAALEKRDLIRNEIFGKSVSEVYEIFLDFREGWLA